MTRMKWLGKWEEATPEDDLLYRLGWFGRNESLWIGYAPPQLDKSDKSTLGTLLRKKCLRSGFGPIKPVAVSQPVPPQDSLHDPWIDG